MCNPILSRNVSSSSHLFLIVCHSLVSDAAYTLDMDTLHTSLNVGGRGKDGIGGVMVASLSSAASGYDIASNRSKFRRHVAGVMSINPQATGEDNEHSNFYQNMEYQNILRLNAMSMVLYLVSRVVN